MTWREFMLARLLLSEERLGARLREVQRADRAADEQTKAILRERGMVG